MNLTIVRELLLIYKNENDFNLKKASLTEICEKLKHSSSGTKGKNSTTTKLNNSQLAPACWNLLVQINKLASSNFYEKTAFLLTSRVVLSSAKVVKSSQKEFKMGQLDLDKILANLIAKLTEGFKQQLINDFPCFDAIELMKFIFGRLHKHLNLLESEIRRMSLVDLSLIDDPFIDVNFQGFSPEIVKDPVLQQITVVALESLCRLILIYQKGPIEKAIETLNLFHSVNSHVSHFISSVCKLEFWSPLEWKFWNSISSHETYKQHLGSFKKRCHLSLTPPTSDISNLNMKIISVVLMSGQLTGPMLEITKNCTDYDDEIIGSCLSILIKDDSQKYFVAIKEIIEMVPRQTITESGLKALLHSLDDLRNGLFHLIRSEQFALILTYLNDCLIRIKLPSKFYVSWTSYVLKAALDHRKSQNIPKLVKVSVDGLLELFDEISEDMKLKVEKIILQSISVSGDCDLIRKCCSFFNDSLESILKASMLNLPQDYFYELSSHVLSNSDVDESLLISWIKVLSCQIHADYKCFSVNNLSTLYLLAKLIVCEVFDQIKTEQYLEFIYTRMRDIGCNQDTIVLSKQLLSFKNPKMNSPSLENHIYKDLNIRSAIDLIRSYQVANQINLKNHSFKNVIIPENSIEFELFTFVLNLALVHCPKDDFKEFLEEFDGSIVHRMKCLFLDSNILNVTYNSYIFKLHSHYQKGNFTDAIKVGYEKLKLTLKNSTSGIEKTFETVELIVYLHRLSVSTKNLSEARYFLKQLFQLSESLKSESIKGLTEGLQDEMMVLMGSVTNFIDYSKCEALLTSNSYKMFSFEYSNLVELDKFRKQIKTEPQTPIACSGIKINNVKSRGESESMLLGSNNYLKEAQRHKLTYCVSEWAKISLYLTFNKSLKESCESELLELFELARNPSFESDFTKIELKGSIGLLCDQFLSVLWVLVVTFDSKVLMFKVNINMSSFRQKVQRIHETCAQNTDSLRNTLEIAKDSEKKAQWWKLRKSLDSELMSVCNDLNDEMFSTLSELLIPNSNTSSLISRNLYNELNELIRKLSDGSLKISEVLVDQLVQWGQCPSRFKIESLIKMLKFASKFNAASSSVFSSEEFDSIVIKFRKCFENSMDSGFPMYKNLAQTPINLILDKDLNTIPFETFNLLNKFTFKRTPVIKKSKNSEEFLRKVFYIINPSGDLYQTQERFENLFKCQPHWNGVIGRKPTPEEFFNGICGLYDLFIYFGHSGGEIYAPLKELKTKLSKNGASSALLIGCSSGRIKSNGIFPAESSIFHYLENESPLVLANLWDVTDKDIDMYIKGVLEDSDLLLPLSPIESEQVTLETTANNLTIIEKAQLCRQRCYLKALNGYAPIVYGLI